MSYGHCFIKGCAFHSGVADPKRDWPVSPLPIESGYVVRQPDAPTRICWQATEEAQLTHIADELGAPIEKVANKLYRISIQANDYCAWSLPENLRKLAA